mgnify:FL=1
MNKQEAIELLRDVAQRVFYRTGRRSVHIDKIVELVNQIDEPQKVVVPKFVAEWIESQKESFSDTSAIDMYENLTSDNRGGYYHEVWLWVIANHYDFIKAWHDGYEIEQEKLYTVEIPNPNSAGGLLVLFKQQSSGRLILDILNPNTNKPKYLHITEAEIKKDFEWAFQFAKPVEEK